LAPLSPVSVSASVSTLRAAPAPRAAPPSPSSPWFLPSRSVPHRHLHPFPTRRSSDLGELFTRSGATSALNFCRLLVSPSRGCFTAPVTASPRRSPYRRTIPRLT